MLPRLSSSNSSSRSVSLKVLIRVRMPCVSDGSVSSLKIGYHDKATQKPNLNSCFRILCSKVFDLAGNSLPLELFDVFRDSFLFIKSPMENTSVVIPGSLIDSGNVWGADKPSLAR